MVAISDQVRSEGGRSVIIVQDTSRQKYIDDIARWNLPFSDVVRVPGLRERGLWPGLILGAPIDGLKDRRIQRMVAMDRQEMQASARRCGVTDEGFAETHWERNCKRLRYYHPGHPNGEALADMLTALVPTVGPRLPFLEDLERVVRPALGMYQGTNHPVSPRVAELLDIEWAGSPFYQAWMRLRPKGPQKTEAAAALEAAEAALADSATWSDVVWPYRIHFGVAVARHQIRAGRTDRGLELLLAAVRAFSGFSSLVRLTLLAAERGSRPDVIQATLAAAETCHEDSPGRPHLVAAITKAAANDDGRNAVLAARARIAEGHWLADYIDEALSA
jgi:hypothetical protein